MTTEDGIIQYLNRKTQIVVVGSSAFDYVPVEHHEPAKRALRELFATGKEQVFECVGPPTETWYEVRSGPIERDGRIVAAVHVVTDISARKVAERALRVTESHTRTLADAHEESLASLDAIICQIPDCLLIHRRGQIVYANPAWKTRLGYEQEEVVGRSIFEFVHPDDHKIVHERTRHLEETGESLPPVEIRALKKNGEVLHLELGAGQMINYEGQRSTLAVGRDITRRKASLERLLSADRVTAMGTLAAGVAHEINNPLTYVIGNLTFAARGLADVAAQDDQLAPRVLNLGKAIADARSGAERVRHIVGDLRVLSAPREDEPTITDIRRILDTAINLAWSAIRYRARLVREYGETPLVRGSGTHIGQVFLNLLVNAAQAIEEGALQENRIHVFTGTDEGGNAIVEIRDTGRGFAPDLATEIFEPFFTTRRVGEAAGLGLSVCRSVVKGLGGEISASSDGKSGATVRVMLPPAEGLPEDHVVREPEDEEQDVHRSRILIIDDEPVLAALVRRVLEEHDVYIVTSGRDAIEFCKEQEFDLIMCDLMMPDVSGMELFDVLKRERPGRERQMIFMTAGPITPRAQRFLAEVPNRSIDKPFDIDDIKGIVRRFLQKAPPNGGQ